MLSLEETKLYLRVDSDEEDNLITSFIKTSREIVEDILRFNLSEYETLPETIKQAMLFIVATLYESRQVGNGNEIKMKELIETVRRMISQYRKMEW